MFIASTTRTERGDSNDTRDIVKRLARLRAERARLLGYPSLAAYVLDDQMAKTPDIAIIFTPGSYKGGVLGLLDDFPGLTCGGWLAA